MCGGLGGTQTGEATRILLRGQHPRKVRQAQASCLKCLREGCGAHEVTPARVALKLLYMQQRTLSPPPCTHTCPHCCATVLTERTNQEESSAKSKRRCTHALCCMCVIMHIVMTKSIAPCPSTPRANTIPTGISVLRPLVRHVKLSILQEGQQRTISWSSPRELLVNLLLSGRALPKCARESSLV